MSGPTQEQMERAILAAANREEDPLKNWARLRNEECPICMLPLPFKRTDINYCVTCDKTVCTGCVLSTCIVHRRDGADRKTAIEKAMTCPFCRSNTRVYDKSLLEKEMKRANAGNSESMRRVGEYYFHGFKGLQQDKAEGLKWYHRAVEAGNGRAAFYIGNCYLKGDCVDEDIDKELEYFQKAADFGYIPSFAMIGELLMEKGEIEEGVLNLRKAATCGIMNDFVFGRLRNSFREGFITKDEYAFTLRENQNACNEMKSEGREKARALEQYSKREK